MSFRLKPVIGATYQTLKEKLQGLGKDVQASDTSDLDYESECVILSVKSLYLAPSRSLSHTPSVPPFHSFSHQKVPLLTTPSYQGATIGFYPRKSSDNINLKKSRYK